MLLSSEFHEAIAAPLARGDFVAEGRFERPPDPALRVWLTQKVPLSSGARLMAGAPGTGWRKLLAALLGDEPFLAALQPDRRPEFRRLAAVLEARRPPLSRVHWDTGVPSLPVGVLDRLCSGLTIVNAEGLRIEADGVLRSTTPDSALTLTLGADAAAAPCCEITFAVEGARAEAEGELRLEAPGAEPAVLTLRPGGRAIYSALLCPSSRGAALRWRLDRAVDIVRLAGLAARPVSRAELLERAQGHESELARVLDGFRDPAECSRELNALLNAPQPPNPADYGRWIRDHELAPDAARRHWGQVVRSVRDPPLISLVTPVYDPPEFLLREMLNSVLEQIYPRWELCLADDASRQPHVRSVLDEYASRDPRIRVLHRPGNGHISAASNSALGMARGDWIALLDHDDRLPAHALAAVTQEIDRHPEAALIYSDEDKIDVAGRRFDPYFKPDFSPHLLRSQNVVSHLGVYRTDLVRALGGFRLGYEGSQDHDLALRVVEAVRPDQVRHIPQVLYHWRSLPGSTAADAAEKPYAADAGRRAVQDHLTRLGIRGAVEPSPAPGWMRVRPDLPQPPPRVSLIVTADEDSTKLREQLRAITSGTAYPDYEVLVLGGPPETAAVVVALQQDRVRLAPPVATSDLAPANAEASGSIIGLLGPDTRPLADDWLAVLAAWAAQPEIGCVGPKLLFSDGRVASAGVVVGGAAAGHPHQGALRSDHGYFGRLVLPHDVSAVDPGCLLVRRSVYDEIGGVSGDDEASAGVDLCLRARSRGYWNVVVPQVELGVAPPPAIIDGRRDARGSLDPFCSPHLTLHRAGLGLG